MELKQVRKFKGDKYTISDFYIDGVKICNICEDPVRVLIDKNKDGDFDDAGEGKVYGDTAIPLSISLLMRSPDNSLHPVQSVQIEAVYCLS